MQNIPLMDGKECLSDLKKDQQVKRIPVIMFTTSSQSKDIEETMLRGAICFIIKPKGFRELKNILLPISQNINGNPKKCLHKLSSASGTFIVS